MSKPHDPAHRPSLSDRMAFRETFLLHAPPAGVTALRHFGRYMYEAIVDSRMQEVAELGMQTEVRAVAEDFRFSAQVLANLTVERERADLTAAEAALALKAESWAREVLELVRAIEAEVTGAGGSS